MNIVLHAWLGAHLRCRSLRCLYAAAGCSRQAASRRLHTLGKRWTEGCEHVLTAASAQVCEGCWRRGAAGRVLLPRTRIGFTPSAMPAFPLLLLHGRLQGIVRVLLFFQGARRLTLAHIRQIRLGHTGGDTSVR